MQETQETWVWFLDWEYPLETGTATHSSIAWIIPWRREYKWAPVHRVTRIKTCAKWLRVHAGTRLLKVKLPTIHLIMNTSVYIVYINTCLCMFMSFTGGTVVKNLPVNVGDVKRQGFDPWVGKLSWSRKWQRTPVFLPGKLHGQEEPGALQIMERQRIRHD